MLCYPFWVQFQKARKQGWKSTLVPNSKPNNFAHFGRLNPNTITYIGSSLIASCGSQRRKKFLSSNLFFWMIAWSYLMHGSLTFLGVRCFFLCLHFGLLVFLHVFPWWWQFNKCINPEIYEIKTKPNWSHAAANYLTHSNKKMMLHLFDFAWVLESIANKGTGKLWLTKYGIYHFPA